MSYRWSLRAVLKGDAVISLESATSPRQPNQALAKDRQNTLIALSKIWGPFLSIMERFCLSMEDDVLKGIAADFLESEGIPFVV